MDLRESAMDRLTTLPETADMTSTHPPLAPGDLLENPVTGECFAFTHTAASTRGELLAFDLTLRPGGAVPVPHVHPVQAERFEVVAGSVRFRVGRRTHLRGPGDVLEVAPGTTHGFANAGPGDARMRVEVRPALAMESMLVEVVALARAGRMTRRGLPRSPLDLAVLARRYDREAHAPLVGLHAQRLLLAPLVLAAGLRRPRVERAARGAGAPRATLVT